MGSKGIPDCAKHWQKPNRLKTAGRTHSPPGKESGSTALFQLSKKKNKLSNKQRRRKISPALVSLSLLALLSFVWLFLFCSLLKK